MKVGLQLPSFTWPGGPAEIAPRLAEIATIAEEEGFGSLWVMDHLFQLPPDTFLDGPDKPMLEAYTTLGYLARSTSRVALGALVGAVHFRPPAVAIKAATTLDVLSGGRAWFGIGAGWYEHESRGLGIQFPERAERFRLLEDTLELAIRMWCGDRSAYQGLVVTAAEPILNPPALQRPRPRIMVAGSGERKTLRLVARYADACNIGAPDPGESRAKLAVLRRHCEELGRPYDEIEKTALVEIELRPGRMSTRDVVGILRAQADEGIENVIVNMPNAHELEPLRRIGREIIPAVAELAPAA